MTRPETVRFPGEIRANGVICHSLGYGSYAHVRESDGVAFEWHGAEEMDASLKRPGIDEHFSDVCSVSRALNDEPSTMNPKREEPSSTHGSSAAADANDSSSSPDVLGVDG